MLFAVRIGLGFQFQTVGSVSNDLVIAFGLGYADIGTLVGMFMVQGLFLAIPAGFSGRYFSDRTLCGLGMLALALGGLGLRTGGGSVDGRPRPVGERCGLPAFPRSISPR